METCTDVKEHKSALEIVEKSVTSATGHAAVKQLYTETLYDALPMDDTVIENLNCVKDEKISDCVKVGELEEETGHNIDIEETEFGGSEVVKSALSQLLDYGLSDTEDSQSDSEDSDSDSESNNLKLVPKKDDAPMHAVEFRANDSSSDSSMSSEYVYESDSSSSISDIGACGVTPPAPEKKRPVEKLTAPRTQGEISLDDLPPIEELKISVAEEECIEIGVVTSIIDQLVIVQSLRGIPAYDIDTLLFLNRGSQPLGRVFDVLGPVTEPFYAVRFNSYEQALESGVKPGSAVYCAPQNTQHTSYVFVSELMKMKGSDASWEHNNEPPDSYLDYSDDEEERKARRMARSKGLPALESHQKTNSLERNQKFEKQMNDKNLLMNERFKSQQAALRKKKPPMTRGMGGPTVMAMGGAMGPAQPPPWVMHNAPGPLPRPEFWSAPPYQFAAYPPYMPVFPNLGVQPPSRGPFMGGAMMGGVQPTPPPLFHGPHQSFNPSVPPPIMRPQPVSYFPNPRHPRWLTNPGLGVLQPPRGTFGNGSSYTQ